MRQRDVNINQFFLPGDYDSPLTSSGSARTIAAVHLAQGNVDVLTSADMRRDVLSALMSASAVGYWLSPQGWLEKSSKVGAVQLLRLTDKGLNTCTNSVQGGSNVPTTRELVSAWRRRMLVGEAGWKVRTFPPLPLLEG